jgi:hypothetical protein
MCVVVGPSAALGLGNRTWSDGEVAPSSRDRLSGDSVPSAASVELEGLEYRRRRHRDTCSRREVFSHKDYIQYNMHTYSSVHQSYLQSQYVFCVCPYHIAHSIVYGCVLCVAVSLLCPPPPWLVAAACCFWLSRAALRRAHSLGIRSWHIYLMSPFRHESRDMHNARQMFQLRHATRNTGLQQVSAAAI